MGEDNVTFSVDYPFEETRVASSFLESAAISEAQRQKIASGNAERILNLSTRARH